MTATLLLDSFDFSHCQNVDMHYVWTLLWVVPPVVTLAYAILCLLFLAIWGEVSWTNAKTWHGISIRLGFCVTMVAIGVGMMCHSNGNETQAERATPLVVVLLLDFISLSLAALLIQQTRVQEISGPEPSTNSMTNKVVIVTGANTGIGKETTRQLWELGATVVMACRSEAKARMAMEDILASVAAPSIDGTGPDARARLCFLPLDLSNFSSIRKSVKLLENMKNVNQIDILINNAGVMMQDRHVTVDGHETMMQANHFGHFLFTLLLLPKLLKQSGDEVRILNLSSITYKIATKGFDFDDYNCASTRPHSLFGQYAQSKLANILFTKELARRYSPKIKCWAINPGIVRTDVTKNMHWFLKNGNQAFGFVLTWFQKQPREGAWSSVWAATCKSNDNKAPPNGTFLYNSHVEETTNYTNNVDVAKRLWALSEDVVGIKAPQI